MLRELRHWLQLTCARCRGPGVSARRSDAARGDANSPPARLEGTRAASHAERRQSRRSRESSIASRTGRQIGESGGPPATWQGTVDYGAGTARSVWPPRVSCGVLFHVAMPSHHLLALQSAVPSTRCLHAYCDHARTKRFSFSPKHGGCPQRNVRPASRSD
jgi:hypothetical protein